MLERIHFAQGDFTRSLIGVRVAYFQEVITERAGRGGENLLLKRDVDGQVRAPAGMIDQDFGSWTTNATSAASVVRLDDARSAFAEARRQPLFPRRRAGGSRDRDGRRTSRGATSSA
jgi:hypothetical protein